MEWGDAGVRVCAAVKRMAVKRGESVVPAFAVELYTNLLKDSLTYIYIFVNFLFFHVIKMKPFLQKKCKKCSGFMPAAPKYDKISV